MSRRLTHFVLILVTFLSTSRSENCDKYGIRLYEDMECKPIVSKGQCPTNYDCTLRPPNPNQCVVRGKIYNEGESIPRNTKSHSCQFGCVCSSRISCPQWGCGDWAGFPPVPPGCHRGYTMESCCSTGILCPPFNDTTTCTVDGTTYKAGEKFAPKDSCWVCVCQKGFTGKYEEPYCKRGGCDAQVFSQEEIQKFCAPLYTTNEKRCCPKRWICPDGNENINSSVGQKSNLTCKYGDNMVNIGASFEKENGKIRCECKIPPLVMCYEL